MKRFLPQNVGGQRADGFTLPEVSIAVAVCMIGLVGIIALLPNALKNARTATDLPMAARIADSELAQYRVAAAVLGSGQPFTPPVNWPPWNSSVHYYTSEGRPCLVDDVDCYFEVRISHTNRYAPVYGTIRDVTVWVRWPYRRAGGRTGAETRAVSSNCFVTSVAPYQRP